MEMFGNLSRNNGLIDNRAYLSFHRDVEVNDNLG